MLYTVTDKTNNELINSYASQDGYKYTKQDLVDLLNGQLEVWEEINNEPGYRECYTLDDDTEEIIQELDEEFDFSVKKVED